MLLDTCSHICVLTNMRIDFLAFIVDASCDVHVYIYGVDVLIKINTEKEKINKIKPCL